MTVESAFRQGEFSSFPDTMIEAIGRSNRYDGRGFVKLQGGTVYITRETFGELAKMAAESEEVK